MIGLLAPGLLAEIALGGAIWPWTRLFDRRPTLRVLSTLVLLPLAVVLLQVGLGLFGLLAPVPAQVCAVLTPLALAGAWLGYGRRLAHNPPAPIARPTALGLGLGVLTAVVYAGVVVVGTLVPPYGWDSLVYHLSDVFHAAQQRSLTPLPFPSRNAYYPQVAELHSLWFYLLSGGGAESWRVTGLALVPFALTAGIATRALGEVLGLQAALPWLAPGVMLAPVVMIQPLAGYVDVAFAGFVLAALAFAALAAERGEFAELALCAVAGGLALGVKFSFLYFCLPVVLVLAAARPWRALLQAPRRAALMRLGVLLALVLAGCGYWLGRNWIDTGNPLYPSRVRVAGVTVFDGPKAIEGSKHQQDWFVPSTPSWLRYPFYEAFRGRPRYTIENGFGPQFAAGFIATPIVLVLAFRTRRFALLRVLLGLPLTLFLWLEVNLYQEPRYVIACCGIAMVALATLAEAVAGRLDPTATEVVGRWPLRSIHVAMAAALMFSAAGGLASAAPDLDKVTAGWKHGGWTPEEFFDLHYGSATGHAFEWIATHSTEGKTVTLTNGTFIAPIFGWHNRNRVVHAPTPGDLPIGTSPRRGTRLAWRRFLLEERVDWIVAWRPDWDESEPRRNESWIAGHPDEFRLLADFPGAARIYEPVFDESARAALSRDRELPDLSHLSEPDVWSLEYAEGATAEWSASAAGGVELRYRFPTVRNDFADLRGDIDERDWSGFGTLGFELRAEPAPALLFVYLKERDPRNSARFRIELGSFPEGRQRVRLPLRAPERTTGRFDLSRVSELHLVLDDADDAGTGSGTLDVSGFELEKTPTTTVEIVPVPEEASP